MGAAGAAGGGGGSRATSIAALRPAARKAPLFHRRYAREGDPLTGQYAPRDVANRSFDWVFRRPSGARWVVFETEVYTEPRAAAPIWRAFAWSPVCEGAR